MTINKIFTSFAEAVADIKTGSTVFIGNFAGPGGTPYFLIKALAQTGVQQLTIVANTAGGTGLTLEYDDHRVLFQNRQVKKVIASFPFSTSAKKVSEAEKQITSGEVELEMVPQGTLAERIRAGGAGIAAFYTPTGPGTVIEENKEKRFFSGKAHLLEYGLRADFALVRAWKADRYGNLIFRGTQRQFNSIMAMAADVTIAEVDEIVAPGQINPNCVVVPGLYVKRIIKVSEPTGFPRHLEFADFHFEGGLPDD
jgi:3-oxoacid CoA-transferase A subunit